jgi:peptidoglycan/LPS O-acetylase OafA/YrhL
VSIRSGNYRTVRPLRLDIEGLRAIAVIAVIIDHLVPSALSGGFAGVDLFFVISGYLIGMHLLEDIQSGQFSFAKFYVRRVRRLLPALVTMLVAVWIVGWVILTGPEFNALGKHVAAATIFSNNFLLWSESGYFDAPSATKPLLHLWSLGIEEQFYLLVPLLLWLSSRNRHASIRVALIASAISLIVTCLRPVASFYLLDTRFWELGAGVTIGYLSLPGAVSRLATMPRGRRHWEIGALALALMFAAALSFASKDSPWSNENRWATSGSVALFVLAAMAAHWAASDRQPQLYLRLMDASGKHRQLILNAVGSAGAALILASLFTMTSKDWPGPQTLFPVLGTACIITAGPDGFVNKLLAIRPLAFFGSISYPLYLWHWPVIVFCRMMGLHAGVMNELVQVGAAVLLAWVTRNLVENPVRFGKLWSWEIPRPPTWTVTGALLVAGALGASAVATEGYPTRFPPALRAIANWSLKDSHAAWRVNECYYNPGGHEAFAPACTPPKRPGVIRVLLWGDSHAAHLYPGIAAQQRQSRAAFDVIQWTAAGCPATRVPLAQEERSCDRRRAAALQGLTDAAPDIVILSSAWELYMDAGSSQKSILAAVEDDIESLQEIRVRRIVIFGPGPTWDTSLPTDIFRSMRFRPSPQIPRRFGTVTAEVWNLDAGMAALARSHGVEYMSILEELCNPQGCRVLGDTGKSPPDWLFQDRDHLTVSGSQLILAAAAPRIFGAPYR